MTTNKALTFRTLGESVAAMFRPFGSAKPLTTHRELGEAVLQAFPPVGVDGAEREQTRAPVEAPPSRVAAPVAPSTSVPEDWKARRERERAEDEQLDAHRRSIERIRGNLGAFASTFNAGAAAGAAAGAGSKP